MGKALGHMEFNITGIKEIANLLDTIIPKEANKLLQSTVNGITGEIRKKAKANAIRIGQSTISKAIKSKPIRNTPPGKPGAIVFIEHGTSAKHDAWFWRFFEFGTANRVIKGGRHKGRAVGRIREQPFIRPAVRSVFAKLPTIIREQFQKKLTAQIKRLKKQIAQGKLVPK